MTLFKSLKRAANIFAHAILAINIIVMMANGARAAADTELVCKASNYTAMNLDSLGIHLSSAVPIGTIVYEGSMTVDVQCGIDLLKFQYAEGLSAEVYFKRLANAEGSLGYGLTMYLGYGGEYSNEAGSVATGQMITTYAGITGGGILNNYTNFTLTVPFRIVKTSSSQTPVMRTDLSMFRVGSQVAGSDANFTVRNLRTFVTLKNETCKAASNAMQEVALGDYSVSKSSGLGSGIGQTSSAIPFSIQLNCEALLSGTFDVMMKFDGDAVSGLSDSGVVALNSTSTASGVGVQILNGNQQPIALATPFAVASYPLSNALVTVPLYARYYQTASTISPGTANAVAQYTISYQ